MTMKIRLKKKNRSHRPMSTHGHEYTNCKMCLNIMMVICIKQRLRNI